jgi:hypothetical protein
MSCCCELLGNCTHFVYQSALLEAHHRFALLITTLKGAANNSVGGFIALARLTAYLCVVMITVSNCGAVR